MECNRFEVEGILLISGELDAETSNSFLSHLDECATCRTEYDFYQAGKNSFFAPNVFEVLPSAEVDSVIIKKCANPTRVSFFAPFNFPLKKIAAFLFLVVLGMSAPLYFSTVKNTALSQQKENVYVQKVTAEPTFVAASDTNMLNTDSLDSADKKSYVKRGDLTRHAVVPVDVRP